MKGLFLRLSFFKSRIFLALAHAVLMLLLSLMWMNSPLVYEDEYFLARILTVVKKIVFGAETKPDPERFLFLNVAYNKQFIPKLGESEELLGDQVITDRKVLASMLGQIAETKNKPLMVVMDVVLEDASSDDSLLLVNGRKLGDRLIVSANESDGQVLKPAVALPSAVASYTTLQEGLMGITSDAFFKYQPITPDGYKTISLQMYEKLHGDSIYSGPLWNIQNNRPVFRSFIIDHPIRWYDLFLASQEQRYPILYANDFLLLPKELKDAFVANRIIYIGDFEISDMHETIYGTTPGSLILANQFLALEKGEQKIRPIWLMYLLCCFWLLSYQVFWNVNPLVNGISRMFNIKKIKHLASLNNFTRTLGAVTFISITSYFVFGISIGIFFVTVYLQIIKIIQRIYDWILKKIDQIKQKKLLKVQ